MATVKVFKVRWHCKETVTSGGAFVSNNNPDQQGFFVAADQATALGLLPTAPSAPGGASNTNTNVVDEVTEVLSTVTSA